ncbi:MAG: hypothetical protein NC483_03790 [Ruminococcus sp.]|nr:hypothetical protein [Ruminococcus sp.]
MKFNLKRLEAFSVAVCLTVTLGGCSKRISSEVTTPDDNRTIVVTPIPMPEPSNKDTSVDMPVPNIEEKEQIDETLNKEFKFDSTLPIAVPIEELVMEDGTIGYKMPRFYMPFVIDEDKPIPGMVGVLEITDEYKILSGANVTTPDGVSSYRGFEGAVAVYMPYFFAWKLKTDSPDLYNEKMAEIHDELGPAAIAYQVLGSADTIPGIASEVYYSNLESITR